MVININLTIRQFDINRMIGSELNLSLKDGACVLDAIKAIDEEILKKTSTFPIKGYESLIQMIYHPIKERFYRQVAIQAYRQPGVFLNVRENPKMPLPDKAIIILIPEGPCISEWEDV